MTIVTIHVTLNETDTVEREFDVEVSSVAVAALLNQLGLPEKWQSIVLCLSNPNKEAE